MIENFLDFTHTDNVYVTKHHNTLTWSEYKKGNIKLFIASAPLFKPILVEFIPHHQYQMILSPQLSPCKKYICYSKRHLHTHHEILILKNLLNNTSIELPAGHSLYFDKKSHQLLYIQHGDHKIISVSLKNNQQTTLWTAHEAIDSFSLSPYDSDMMILRFKKKLRSFLALCNLKKNTLEWLDPSFSFDTLPVWSPKKNTCAFLRYHYEINNNDNPPLPESYAPSFSIILFDLNTKQKKILWDSGSCFIKEKSTQPGNRLLQWLDEDHLIFCHEGNGWEHIYQIHCISNQITAITKGDFLVRDFTVCTVNRSICYTHNELKNYHYTMDLLTVFAEKTNQKHEWIQPFLQDKTVFQPQFLGPTGRYIVFLYSTYQRSCHIAILDQHLKKIIDPQSKYHPSAQSPEPINPSFIKPSYHMIKTADKKTCYAQMLQAKKTKQMAIIFLHDGPCQQSIPAFQPHLEMSYYYALCQFLAHQGLTILDVNYRGSCGYHSSFRNAKERGWHGASEYEDILAARKWLATQPSIDPQKIGIMGKGWGGYLTSFALSRDSQFFHAGVDLQGYHHFPRLFRATNYFNRYHSNALTCIEAESATQQIAYANFATEYSPWDKLDDWMSPVLFVYNDQNDHIPFEETQKVYQKLIKQGVHAEALIFPQEKNIFIDHQSWITVAKKIEDFFKKTLS